MRGITGKLNITIEPGTILGPDNIGEFHVAVSTEDGVTQCAYASPVEIRDALLREPRSVAEASHRTRLAALL